MILNDQKIQNLNTITHDGKVLFFGTDSSGRGTCITLGAGRAAFESAARGDVYRTTYWFQIGGLKMADIDRLSERLVDLAERFADVTDAAQGRGNRQGGIRARWFVVPAAAAGVYMLGASGSLRRQAGNVAKQAKDRASDLPTRSTGKTRSRSRRTTQTSSAR